MEAEIDCKLQSNSRWTYDTMRERFHDADASLGYRGICFSIGQLLAAPPL